jgi:hypothetical protein
LPKTEAKAYFHEAINDAATDETLAHMCKSYSRTDRLLLIFFPFFSLTITLAMFFPKDNPGYFAMSEEARTLIGEWTENDWYESSTGYQLAIEQDL